MAAPRKYPEELRERAIRMAVDLRRDPATRSGALRRVGDQLGINPETLRNWLNKYRETHGGTETEVTLDERARLKELERENSELRAETAFLKKAAAYFAREQRP